MSYKKNLLAHCRTLQNNRLADLTKIYQDYRESADLDEDDTSDPEDYSHQEEWGESAMKMKERMDRAQADLNTLKSFPLEDMDRVTIGAVVLTPDMGFIIGLAIPNFEFEGKKFVGISENAPIYKAMEGLANGDEFAFMNKKYRIEQLL